MNISLFYSNGDLIDQTVSDEGGFYSFENVEAGDVYLQFELPNGYTYTIADQGDDLSDSDVNSSIRATIDGQELFVPLDPANRHYAEIMRQVEAGTLTVAAAE